MTLAQKFAAALMGFSVAVAGCSKQSPVAADASDHPDAEQRERAIDPPPQVAEGPLQDLISVDFPKKAYTFTLAEVAKGIQFDYTIAVVKDIAGVIPVPQDDGLAAGPGPSGLFPFEKISGNGQSCSLRDIGLAPPQEKPPRTILQGKYRSSFAWDGRNWIGPSDFGNPKGDPFPPGNYTIEVRMIGEVETPQGKVPYEISKSVPVKLAP